MDRWRCEWTDEGMNGWTGNETYNPSEDVWRSDRSRYITLVETNEQRKKAPDVECYEKDDMSARLKLRFFKMKECENRMRKEESSCVSRGESFLCSG